MAVSCGKDRVSLPSGRDGDKLLAATLSQPADKQPVAAKIKQERGDLARIDDQIAEIDARLKKELPEYVALSSPDALDIVDVQTQLGASEALVLFLDTPSESPKGELAAPEATFIWVVTKSDSRWIRIDLGTKALKDRVGALRCGLNSSNWTNAGQRPDGDRGQQTAQRGTACATGALPKRLTSTDVSDKAMRPFD